MSHNAEESENSPESPHLGEIKRMRKLCVPGAPPFFTRAGDKASNEHGCLGRDLCCGVNCHLSRLMQCTRPSSMPSVSTEIPQTLKELMITSVAMDFQAFFTQWRQRRLSGALILPSTHAHSAGSIQGWGKFWLAAVMCVVRDLFEGRKKSKKYSNSYIPHRGVVMPIDVGLRPTPMCKTTTPQGEI